MSDTFILGQGPGHKLEKAIGRNGGKATDIEWLSTGRNFETVMRLARGEAVLAVMSKPVLIWVDRKVKPDYPDFVKKVLHPEFEANGPTEFDLSKVEQWLHRKQMKRGFIFAKSLHTYLRESDLLKTCLTLRDGEEIRKIDIKVFRRFFRKKHLYLWGSVVRDENDDLLVPFLHGQGSEIMISWQWFTEKLRRHCPAGLHMG